MGSEAPGRRASEQQRRAGGARPGLDQGSKAPTPPGAAQRRRQWPSTTRPLDQALWLRAGPASEQQRMRLWVTLGELRSIAHTASERSTAKCSRPSTRGARVILVWQGHRLPPAPCCAHVGGDACGNGCNQCTRGPGRNVREGLMRPDEPLMTPECLLLPCAQAQGDLISSSAHHGVRGSRQASE